VSGEFCRCGAVEFACGVGEGGLAGSRSVLGGGFVVL
jgi:hypothetical protein